MSIIHTLGQSSESGSSDFSIALPSAASMLGHKGLVAVFSDLLGDTDHALETLQTLSCGKHDIMLFHLLDPEEIELNNRELTDFTTRKTLIKSLSADPDTIRSSYRKIIQEFIDKIENKCQETKITWCFINTSSPFDLAIHDFMKRRRNMM